MWVWIGQYAGETFGKYAAKIYREKRMEAVALIGHCLKNESVLIPLHNMEHRHNVFEIDAAALEDALRLMGRRFVMKRVMLAHSHSGRSCEPSYKDVGGLGDPKVIEDVSYVLRSFDMDTPLLHLIYALRGGSWGLWEIDQRIGPIVTHRRKERPLGWKEVTDDRLFGPR